MAAAERFFEETVNAGSRFWLESVPALAISADAGGENVTGAWPGPADGFNLYNEEQ